MRPMKGVKVEDKDLSRLILPMWGSRKYDGIRSIVPNCQAKTTKMKPIPNKFTREFLSDPKYNDLDGELIVGRPRGEGVFNRTQSGIMSHGGQPDFTFYVFDIVDPHSPYLERKARLLNRKGYPRLHIVKQRLLESIDDILEFERESLDLGYEGIMLRSIDGGYKYGKSTLRQQWLLKRKPFLDAEGIISGFYEQMENTNEQKLNELGLHKRSKKKEGMVGKGTLGGFIVETEEWGTLRVATGKGMTKERRQFIWDNRDSFFGAQLTFRYLPIGMKDKPRHPISKIDAEFFRFRDGRD